MPTSITDFATSLCAAKVESKSKGQPVLTLTLETAEKSLLEWLVSYAASKNVTVEMIVGDLRAKLRETQAKSIEVAIPLLDMIPPVRFGELLNVTVDRQGTPLYSITQE